GQTPKASRCSKRWACRSGHRRICGENLSAREGRAAGEVQGTTVQPLPPLRPSAGVLSSLQTVPSVPAGSGPQGTDSRTHQGELVGARMSMTDPIADLLTRIRNGAQARKEYVDCPWSTLKERIVRVMISEGYIQECSVI